MDKNGAHYTTQPPKAAEYLISIVTVRDIRNSVLGDMAEQFHGILAEQGVVAATFWYWMQVFVSIPGFLTDTIRWRAEMLKNYLRLALRNIYRKKVFAAINIIGLGVGIACCLLIYLYIHAELSFNGFHRNGENIYRIISARMSESGDIEGYNRTLPAAMQPLLLEAFPEVETAVRLMRQSATVRGPMDMFNETILLTDEGFFQTFTFPLKYRSGRRPLSSDADIILTEQTAYKYFGSGNPVGKSLLVIFGENRKQFTVAGVAFDPPPNSSIQFDLLININNLPMARGVDALNRLGDFSAQIYIQLTDNVQPDVVSDRFPFFFEQTMAAEIDRWRTSKIWQGAGMPYLLELQPLAAMHWDTRIWDSSDPQISIIMGIIAMLILAIAGINFVNLSIGQASARFTEIGMRKILGARRSELVRQFWMESLLVVVFAFGIALALTQHFLPYFNDYVQRDLQLGALLQPVNLLLTATFIFFVSLLTGSYPAWSLSRLQPVSVLKGQIVFAKGSSLSRLLIISQFALAVFLMISTIVLSKQIDYMLGRDTGFYKESVAVIDLQERNYQVANRQFQLLRNKISGHREVEAVSATSDGFGRSESSSYLSYKDRQIKTYRYHVDGNYLATLKMQLLQGRFIRGESPADSQYTVVNQSLVEALELQDPIGQTVFLHNRLPLKIIGVVADYHFTSLTSKIAPAMLYSRPRSGYRDMLVRLHPNALQSGLQKIEAAWQEIQPDKPFQYSFLDDDLASFYTDYQRTRAVLQAGTFFAFLIACMGIFGLSMLASSRRIKEIGIRKVLGASALQITALLIRELLLLVVLANLAAWPFAWLILNDYLTDFYYRISIDWQYFLLAGVITVGTALISVGYLAIKAAISNPVEALRYE